MRRSRAALAVLTMMLMSLFVAGPASAGGPTSVLLVVHGTGQTASLYTGTADYEALAGLVGASPETSSVVGKVDRSGTSHAVGKAMTLTWLAHNVHVWRVDWVYLEAAGGPWIATQLQSSEGLGDVANSPPVWHTAPRGKELAGLLERLGVRPDPRGEGSSPGPPSLRGDNAGTRIAAPAAPAAPAATAAAEMEKPTIQWAGAGIPITAGLVWWFIGLALGVALTLAGMRLLPNSRPATRRLATAGPADDVPPTLEAARPGPTAS